MRREERNGVAREFEGGKVLGRTAESQGSGRRNEAQAVTFLG